MRQDAAGHVDQWPSGIGHWHVCQSGNILAIIFAFEPHYNGNYTQEAATTWASARAPLARPSFRQLGIPGIHSILVSVT